MNERIKYLDVAKFIGIFCIYLGHLTTSAGNAYVFVFSFHVPLFFFLSGCAENLGSDIPWYKYIWKNVKSILIPLYLFAIVSILIQSIMFNSYSHIPQNLIDLLRGCVRNHFMSGGLWFLSCLFVMKIFFYFLRKLLRFKWLILLVCLGLYCVASLVISPSPAADPRMLYNVDSACYYIIFYALGYSCFEPIHKLLRLDSTVKKIICAVLGGISFAYAITLFFGNNLLDYFPYHTVTVLVKAVLCPVIVILLILIVSKLLENVKLFVDIGTNTLYLCGTEYIIKLLIPFCLQMVGLDLFLPNPITAYIYTFALLLIAVKAFVPVEKAIFKKMRIIK